MYPALHRGQGKPLIEQLIDKQQTDKAAPLVEPEQLCRLEPASLQDPAAIGWGGVGRVRELWGRVGWGRHWRMTPTPVPACSGLVASKWCTAGPDRTS